MTTYPIIHRQGDVPLARLPGKPAGILRPGAQGRITLALGETTGHAHVIEGAVAEFVTEQGERLLWVEAPANLRHVIGNTETGEHATQVVQPGWYVVEGQCELTHDDEPRQVYD